MSDAERSYMLSFLAAVPVPMFKGDLNDLFELNELYCLRIGCDDAWLKRLYEIHVALVNPIESIS